MLGTLLQLFGIVAVLALSASGTLLSSGLTDDCGQHMTMSTCTDAPPVAGVPCLWSNGTCQNPFALCEVQGPTATACNALAPCIWNPRLAVCTTLCPLLTTEDACPTNSACQWTRGTCRVACFLKFPTKSECASEFGALSGCEFNPMSGLCEFNCTSLGDNATTCALESSCRWSTASSACVGSCLNRETPNVCVQDSECSWNYRRNWCEAAAPEPTNQLCAALTTSTQCDARSWRTSQRGCKWDATAALCRPWVPQRMDCPPEIPRDMCMEIRDPVTGISLCEFAGNQCVPRCYLLGDFDGCVSLSNCMWNQGNCTSRCETRNFVDGCGEHCTVVPHQLACGYNCSALIVKDGHCHLDQGPTAQCRAEGTHCVPACGVALNATACTATSTASMRCMWSDTFGLCEAV